MSKNKIKYTLSEYFNIAKWEIVLYIILTLFFSLIGFIGSLIENSLIPLSFILAFYVFIGFF